MAPTLVQFCMYVLLSWGEKQRELTATHEWTQLNMAAVMDSSYKNAYNV